jgi:hypothetical protein
VPGLGLCICLVYQNIGKDSKAKRANDFEQLQFFLQSNNYIFLDDDLKLILIFRNFLFRLFIVISCPLLLLSSVISVPNHTIISNWKDCYICSKSYNY